ncbi:hypothetical protein ZWY2020_059767 [Hordeum vulgare]|nr:hypothetical protein ZWY2020_059767 [Hordeum vulgare]
MSAATKDAIDVRMISTKELQAHAAADDLWISISGDVYDVTPWLRHHPGGEVPLITLAGLCRLPSPPRADLLRGPLRARRPHPEILARPNVGALLRASASSPLPKIGPTCSPGPHWLHPDPIGLYMTPATTDN